MMISYFTEGTLFHWWLSIDVVYCFPNTWTPYLMRFKGLICCKWETPNMLTILDILVNIHNQYTLCTLKRVVASFFSLLFLKSMHCIGLHRLNDCLTTSQHKGKSAVVCQTNCIYVKLKLHRNISNLDNHKYIRRDTISKFFFSQ